MLVSILMKYGVIIFKFPGLGGLSAGWFGNGFYVPIYYFLLDVIYFTSSRNFANDGRAIRGQPNV